MLAASSDGVASQKTRGVQPSRSAAIPANCSARAAKRSLTSGP